MLTDKDASTGEYKIPHIIYSDAYASEMVSFADLVLPDTTYLERWDCISLFDRPICDADGVADSIRQPIVKPDRDVRPFQDVLIELGVRLKLPGLIKEDGSGALSRRLFRLSRPSRAQARLRHARGLARRGRRQARHRRAQPEAARRLYRQPMLLAQRDAGERAGTSSTSNRDYLDWAVKMGLIDKAEPMVLQLYSEILQKFRLAAKGHGKVQPPEQHRARVATYFDPLPLWYMPFEEMAVGPDEFPLHALTQRPMAMYHSWGSQNAWLRQIHGENRLHINRKTRPIARPRR